MELKENTSNISWVRVLFNQNGLNNPLSCYEVGKMGCKEIKEKFHGKGEGGIDTYSYVVHFSDGTGKEITNTFSVQN
jgi:hypothetical protein